MDWRRERTYSKSEYKLDLTLEEKLNLFETIVSDFKLRGSAYFEGRFATPWGMTFAKSKVANFHLVSSGECHIEFGDQKCVLKKALARSKKVEAVNLASFSYFQIIHESGAGKNLVSALTILSNVFNLGPTAGHQNRGNVLRSLIF